MKKFLFSMVLIFVLCLGLVACGGGKKITVTFDGNGGQTANGETQVMQEIDPSGNYTTPTFTREGYTFTGWDVEIKNLTKDSTIKAQWKAITYDVVFDVNGGELVSGQLSQKVAHGSNATAPEVKKEGYDFKGWDGSFENITSNKTITATWEIKTYTVTFDLDGGKLVEGAEFDGVLVEGTEDTYVLTVEHGAHVDYPNIEYVSAGVKLGGWEGDSLDNVTANATVKAIWTGLDDKTEHTVTFVLGKENVVYTGELEQIIPLNGDAIAPEVQDLPYYQFMGWDVAFTDVVGDVTVNARWQEIKYDITFDLNGGNLSTGSLTQKTIEGKVTLPTAEKEGYNFIGWFDGETQVDEDTLYTKNTTVKAKWEESPTIIVKFNSNGGTACQDKTINRGEKLGTLPTPSKGFPGEYAFKYWYYIDGSGKQVQVTADTVLDIEAKEITLNAYFKLLWTGFY